MDKSLTQAQKDVMAGVGRNVTMVQILERALKRLLPLIDLDGAPHALAGLAQRTDEVSTKTLGTLGTRFLKASTTDQGFDAALDKLIHDRNQLIHHFHDCGLYDLSSLPGCEAACARLREQFDAIRDLSRMVDSLLYSVFDSSCETTFAGTPEYAEFRAQCDLFAESRGIRRFDDAAADQGSE